MIGNSQEVLELTLFQIVGVELDVHIIYIMEDLLKKNFADNGLDFLRSSE